MLAGNALRGRKIPHRARQLIETLPNGIHLSIRSCDRPHLRDSRLDFAQTIPKRRFDAIAVALLGRSAPVGVLGAALLFGGLQAGALRMQAETSTPVDIVTVIQALILVFVAAPELIRAIYRIKAERTDTPTFTTNWGR